MKNKLNRGFRRICRKIVCGIAVAAVAAQGESELLELGHIARGYERFEENLASIGAQVRREA